MTRHTSQKRVTYNSSRWFSPPNRQRWGMWGQALRCRRTP